MRRIALLICLLISLFTLVSCDPAVNRIDGDELIANTVKIELYEYKNNDPQRISTDGEEKPCFDFSKAELIATLEESYYKDVLTDIAAYDFLLFGFCLSEPMENTLVLHQSNGDMIVLYACVYTNENDSTRYYGDCYLFDKNGVFIEYIGDINPPFVERLVEKYFTDK